MHSPRISNAMRGHRDSGDRRAFVDGTVHLISHAKTPLTQFPPCRPRETLQLDLRIDVFKLKYRKSTKRVNDGDMKMGGRRVCA